MTGLAERVANAVPTNWCDPMLTGDQAIFPNGERVPAWFEPMLLAIRERVRAEAATALEAARGDVERLDWLDTQRGDDVQGRYPSPPELVGHYWSVEGQCYDVRKAIDAARKEPGND